MNMLSLIFQRPISFGNGGIYTVVIQPDKDIRKVSSDSLRC